MKISFLKTFSFVKKIKYKSLKDIVEIQKKNETESQILKACSEHFRALIYFVSLDIFMTRMTLGFSVYQTFDLLDCCLFTYFNGLLSRTRE